MLFLLTNLPKLFFIQFISFLILSQLLTKKYCYQCGKELDRALYAQFTPEEWIFFNIICDSCSGVDVYD